MAGHKGAWRDGFDCASGDEVVGELGRVLDATLGRCVGDGGRVVGRGNRSEWVLVGGFLSRRDV